MAIEYNATQAVKAYRKRRVNCVRQRKLVPGNALHQYVHDRLIYDRWSPQQIAAKLRVMHPHDSNQHVSHETIYAAIYVYARGSLKPAMITALRQAKPARGRKRKTLASCAFVPEALRIQYRPQAIEERLIPRHWEGDFIKGAFNRSAAATKIRMGYYGSSCLKASTCPA